MNKYIYKTGNQKAGLKSLKKSIENKDSHDL